MCAASTSRPTHHRVALLADVAQPLASAAEVRWDQPQIADHLLAAGESAGLPDVSTNAQPHHRAHARDASAAAHLRSRRPSAHAARSSGAMCYSQWSSTSSRSCGAGRCPGQQRQMPVLRGPSRLHSWRFRRTPSLMARRLQLVLHLRAAPHQRCRCSTSCRWSRSAGEGVQMQLISPAARRSATPTTVGIAPVGLLLAHSWPGCAPLAHPQLVPARSAALEPAGIAGGFHAHPHPLPAQAAVEALFRRAASSTIPTLSGFLFLQAMVCVPDKIAAYNHHRVDSFLPSLRRSEHNQSTAWREPTLP